MTTLPSLPDGDWIAEPLLNRKSLLHGRLQNALDCFSLLHEIYSGECYDFLQIDSPPQLAIYQVE